MTDEFHFTSGYSRHFRAQKNRADIESWNCNDLWRLENRWTLKQVRIQLTFNQTLVRYDPSTIKFLKMSWTMSNVSGRGQKETHWSTSKHAISFDQISVIKAKSFLVWSGSPCHKLNVIRSNVKSVVLWLNFFFPCLTLGRKSFGHLFHTWLNWG